MLVALVGPIWKAYVGMLVCWFLKAAVENGSFHTKYQM